MARKGGLAIKSYSPGDLTVGASIAAVVGAGSAGNVDSLNDSPVATAGVDGKILLVWANGTQTDYTTPGSTTFTVPTSPYTAIVVLCYGASSGGQATTGGGSIVLGTDGGDSKFNTTVVGGGGKASTGPTGPPVPGTHSGGDNGLTSGGAPSNGLGSGSGSVEVKTYGPGDLTLGDSIPVVVGAKGTNSFDAAHNGFDGKVSVFVELATSARSFSPGIIG